MLVTTTDNSPPEDYTHPDNQTMLSHDYILSINYEFKLHC